MMNMEQAVDKGIIMSVASGEGANVPEVVRYMDSGRGRGNEKLLVTLIIETF